MNADSKIAVVTGANSGLGYETTAGLAEAGYAVVMACRDTLSAGSAAAAIKYKVPSAKLSVLHLDLIDRASIRGFAKECHGRFGRIDLLVNNAGLVLPPYTITPNDLELQFDANHVGHFLLTSLLMPLLEQAAEARIISVTSNAIRIPEADIYFDNLNFDGTYDDGPKLLGKGGAVAYAQSKLANALFALELSKRLADIGSPIKSLAVHPGVANTNATRNLPAIARKLVSLLSFALPMVTPAQGARPTLYAALEPGLASGEFIGPTDKKEVSGPPGSVEYPAKVLCENLRERFWKLSEREIAEPFYLPGAS